MPSNTQPRVEPVISWTLVVIAGIFAYLLPSAWIHYSDRVTRTGPFLNFHPLFIVIYAPLAFGIIWPVLIGCAALVAKSSGNDRTWPVKRALIVFIFSAACAGYFSMLEWRHVTERLDMLHAEDLRNAQLQSQQAAEWHEALAVLETKGIDAFNEPLTGPQLTALKQYFDRRPGQPAQFVIASRHYATTPSLMEHLAEKGACPPEALEILYENAVRLQETPGLQQRNDGSNVYQVLYYIAWNPNTPVPVLTKMLDNKSADARRAAAANPRLPKAAKLDYVKKSAISGSYQEREEAAGNPECPVHELMALLESDHPGIRRRASLNPGLPKDAKIAYLRKAAVSKDWMERVWTAKDPDCPPEVLQQLAEDPVTSWQAITNPSMPIDLLQSLSQSSNPQIRGWATASLATRQSRTR